MKFFVCIVVALVALWVAGSDAAIGRANFSNKAYPGKCVIDENTVMSPGQTGKAPKHHCAGVTCLDNGWAEFRTCPAVPPPKGCKLRDFVNINRPYPECCERTYDCTKKI